MKHFWIILIVAISMIMLTSCTVQFKAKEIELEGHSNTTYRFTGFAWTEPTQPLPNPPDAR